jgi:hypothetical protein
VAADLFISGQQQAETHIVLTDTALLKALQVVSEQNHRKGYGIFVVYGAPTVKPTIVFAGFELPLILDFNHIEMGHQHHLADSGFGSGNDGRNPLEDRLLGFDSLAGEPVGYKFGATADLFRPGVDRGNSDKLFGKFDNLPQRVHSGLPLEIFNTSAPGIGKRAGSLWIGPQARNKFTYIAKLAQGNINQPGIDGIKTLS